MKILILCTGNSCRSQMAEGFLNTLEGVEAYSAGTHAAERVHPKAVQVMKEAGMDISSHTPKMVDEFLNGAFDYVITVCDNAKESCPLFSGDIKQQLHFGFEDPAEARGTEEEVLDVFRSIRDQITDRFREFYTELVNS